MANIALLGGGIECLPIIQRVIALGHQAIVIDGNPDAPGMDLADIEVVASCYHTEAVLPALGYALNHHGIKLDAVLCAGTDTPNAAAAVAAAYRLPGLAPEAAALSVDKLAQKRALRSGMMTADVPDFWECGRVVVKPTNSRGARGVKLIETGGMVEQYLDGPQFSTESLVQDGQVLFTAVGLRNYDRPDLLPSIVENGFDAPYFDLPDEYRGVDGLIERACHNLGWYQRGGGVVKGDLVLHNGKLVIIELAARLSGGFFCMAHEWVYGVPFIDHAIWLAFGERLVMPTVKSGLCVSQRYLFPDPADFGRRVVSVPEPLTVHATLGIQHATYAVRPGDVIAPVVSHGQRWGQAIATGSTPEQARERAEAAVAAMKAAIVLE